MELAIGLWRHQGTDELGLLERFARHVDALTYADVYSVETLPTERLLEQMLKQATRIHINLDGMVETFADLPRIIELGSRGFDFKPPSGGGNITNWEIWRLHQNPELLAKTKFYLDGKEIVN